MKLPAFLYGKYAEVKKNAKKVLKDLRSGKPYEEVLPRDLIDTNDYEGMIVLGGPSPLIGGQFHFNMYALMHEFYFGTNKEIDTILEQQIFSKSLLSSWGIFLFMGDAHLRCFDNHPERIEQYLEACYRFREDIFGIGIRFTPGLWYPQELSQCVTSLNLCLAKSGVPIDKIKEARSEERLKELLVDCFEKT